MSIGKSIRVTLVSTIGFAALALPGVAAPPTPIDLAGETVGAEPKAFVPVVGFWRIEDDNGKKVLVVDGRQWKEGQSSAGIADKARTLYGERYAEFLDRVQAYAYFPYVVAPDISNFTDGEISVRFEGLSGRIDQGAVLWKVEKGKRSSVNWVRNTPTATHQWHDLKVRISGSKVEGYLDGKLYLQHTLESACGGWY